MFTPKFAMKLRMKFTWNLIKKTILSPIERFLFHFLFSSFAKRFTRHTLFCFTLSPHVQNSIRNLSRCTIRLCNLSVRSWFPIALLVPSRYFRITYRKSELSADEREGGKESPYETIEGKDLEMRDRDCSVHRSAVRDTKCAYANYYSFTFFFRDRSIHRRGRSRVWSPSSVHMFLRNI